MSLKQSSHDLRARFGFILALALLPLLVFTIWQSYVDYQRDADVQTILLEDVANDAVKEVVNSVTRTKAIMRIAAETMDPANCTTDIGHILENFPRIYNVVMSEPDGTILCSGRLIRSPDSIRDASKRVTITRPFYIDLPDVAESARGPEHVVVVTYGKYENDILDRVVLAGFDVSLLNRLKDNSELPKGTEISVLSPTGNVLLGLMNTSDSMRRDWVFQARNNQKYTTEYDTGDNETREVSIFNAENADLFIAISAPKKNLLAGNKLRSFQSSIIPFLAWLFGFTAIWLSADRLILMHLRKMRLSMLGFARGNHDLRIGEMKEAPDTIAELGRAYDSMADTVQKRENELRISLDGKETLLREIHHRVKNNLQIVISLLNMQERKLKDPEGLSAIRESRNRINAIALVHKALYESDDISLINMNNFISQIIVHLRRALLTDKKNVKISVNVNCPPMDSDRATPIALFIVEAMTNSVKHGVETGGQISVNITELGDKISIVVMDNGTKSIKPSGHIGMGSKLMLGFARQLSGEYTGENKDGKYITKLVIPTFVEKSAATHI